MEGPTRDRTTNKNTHAKNATALGNNRVERHLAHVFFKFWCRSPGIPLDFPEVVRCGGLDGVVVLIILVEIVICQNVFSKPMGACEYGLTQSHMA